MLKPLYTFAKYQGKNPLLTSSINCGIRQFGLNNTSTLHVPPLASRVMGFVGAMLRTPGCCRALVMGVRARVKVIAAGLLFTMGMYFLTTLPMRRGPRFTTLSLGSATSICHNVGENHSNLINNCLS